MRYLVGCIRLLGVGLLIVAILSVLVFFPFFQQATRGRWVKRLSGVLMRVFGIRVTIHGQVPREQAADCGISPDELGYMVCSNHISFVDIFVLNVVLPCRFVAKKEIASWPVFGFISRKVGTLFIDRSRKRAVIEIAEMMSSAIQDGTNVLFFPEGTTGGGRLLLPFYANLFEAAIRSKAEVLPITLRYTLNGETTELISYAGDISLFEVLKRILFTPGLGVEVTVLAPIASADQTRQAVCAKTSAEMANALGVPDATAQREAERRARLASL